MRIILADHNRSTLWALRTLLDEESNMEVVGEATDTQELKSMGAMLGADLMLVDRRLPGGDVGGLIAILHAFRPRPIVVIMSSDFEDGRIMLRAGADAFVSKGERPDWLLQTLRQFADRNNRVGSAG
jgi:DNA-binding NarL/FixJ family response regulator